MRAARRSSRPTGRSSTLKPDADVVDGSSCAARRRSRGVGQGANGLESMRSRDMNLGMADDGQTLQQATLVGDARRARRRRRPTRRRSSSRARPSTSRSRADGQTVQGLSAQDDVQLDLPAASRRRADAADPVALARRGRRAGAARACEPRASTATSSSARASPAGKDKPAVDRVVRAPEARDQAAVAASAPSIAPPSPKA